MSSPPPPRSILRFENFSRAMDGLIEAVELGKQRALTDLEKAGMVQRFELTWELGWKLLADRLSEELAPPDGLTPGATIRSAYAAGMIAGADDWMAMGKLRNQLSHTYSEAVRDQALELVATRFLAILAALRQSEYEHKS